MNVTPRIQKEPLPETNILNKLNIIILSCDSNGQIYYASEGITKITGYSCEEVMGEGWWQVSFVDALRGQQQKNVVMDILKGLAPFPEKPIDRKILCKDGSFRWIEWRFCFGEDNTMVVSGVDITDWKRKEQEKIQADRILSSIDSLVLVSDENSEIVYASPSVERMLGYSQEEVLGNGWWENTYNSSSASRIEKNDIHNFVFYDKLSIRDISRRRIKTKSGEYKWIEWFISKGINNTYISVGTDISKKITSDHALELAKEEAEKSLKVKNEFLANMSHEIRTPLNALLGFTELLLETKLDSEQQEHLETMRNSGGILLSLINNVLDLSKLDSKKLHAEKIDFDLYKSVYEVVKIMKINAQEKGIALNIDIYKDTPRYIVSDSTRFGQIMLNLIGNAIKFTDKGMVNVLIRIEKRGLKSPYLVVDIQDTGIGIMSNKLENVFGAFTQAKSETARIYGGTGLGLCIVKKLVTLLEGDISVESTYGKGSVFSFEFPVEVSLRENTESKFEVNLEEEKKLSINILLVEDNKANQLLASTRLKRWGCTVEIANNGIEAVKKVQKNSPYDLILMDIQMPIMDGFEATKIIKTDLEDTRKVIPIIAMTAHASKEDIKDALKVGMCDCVFKPFDSDVLYQKLVRYTRK